VNGEHVEIDAGGLVFRARLETELSPLTAAALRAMLPFEGHVLQARWSGFAAWIPLGVDRVEVPVESPTHLPRPGQILLYPGGLSEPELLIPYGASVFTSAVGPLVANHVLTVVGDLDLLPELGRRVQWDGASLVSITLVR
jgi:hypothetical protein